MARVHSPSYPNMPLAKAVLAAQKIFSADRTNPIDRVVAAKHIGYGGQSGASDKALASLGHYGLTEKTGKGEIRISRLALDILHPDPSVPEARPSALLEAGLNPPIFKDLFDRFGVHVSEDALRSYLIRLSFQNIAINPVINAYLETCRFLEQEKAFESRGATDEPDAESIGPADSVSAALGGARVGDLVQWEISGVLQMETPMRVRLVTEDGQWIAVEGSETGIPMDQVTVLDRGVAPVAEAPRFAIESPKAKVEELGPILDGWKEERLLDDGGEEIFIRYRGEPTEDRYTYIRDYLDFKLSRMGKSNS